MVESFDFLCKERTGRRGGGGRRESAHLVLGRKDQKGFERSVNSFFITTAIDYTNAAPHIGHAYEKILADVIARYHRLKGEPTFFLTGVDQHGQKVQQAAQSQGIAPQEFVDGITKKFRA